jgi:hypothetical protein
VTLHRTFPNTRAPRSRVPTVPRLVHRVRNHASSILLVAGATAALAACASTRGGPSTPVDYTDDYYAQLTVASKYRQDVNVFLVHGASRTRLGCVDAFSTRVFRLPECLNDLPRRIVLECQQSRGLHETREFSWEAGQQLSLSFGPFLNTARLNLPRPERQLRPTRAPRTIAVGGGQHRALP